MPQDKAAHEKTSQRGNLWLAGSGNYLGRRLESTDPASCLVVLLVLELVSAFEALEAILEDVLTEFFAMCLTSFLMAGGGGKRQRQEEVRYNVKWNYEKPTAEKTRAEIELTDTFDYIREIEDRLRKIKAVVDSLYIKEQVNHDLMKEDAIHPE